jgi:hypothetical protein
MISAVKVIAVSTTPDAVMTRDWASLNELSELLRVTTEAFALPCRALWRKP